MLARSLIVLAALLILIGSLQYFLMRGFLYQNQAETLEAQFRSVPPLLIEEWRADTQKRAAISYEAIQKTGARQQANTVSSDANTDELGSSEMEPPLPPGQREFLLSGLSLAAIHPNGEVDDLNAQYGVPAPILSTSQQRSLAESMTRPSRNLSYVLANDANGNEQLVVLRAADARMPILQIGIPTEPIKAILWRQLGIFAALSVAALAGGVALYRPVLRKSLVPLSRMVNTVKDIDAGRLNERLPDQQGQAEIDRLSLSFNGMLERLEHAFAAEKESQERMRQFIADASHELRTPLTSIRGFLEVLLRGNVISEQQLHSALRSMHSESERMTKLVEDLLALVKLERNPEKQFTAIRPAPLVEELESHLQILAGDRIVQINTAGGKTIQVQGDADQIKQIVLNLFNNAVQHTHPLEGKIQIDLSVHGDQLWLKVQDNGSGIPPELQSKIFERFYRSDQSRSRRSGGAGLGLSISLALAQAHGGSLELASMPGEGSTFTLVLPIYRTE
nr:HAMP domain-containing sensor histidine kinase [Saccharibacillus sp. JS10]